MNEVRGPRFTWRGAHVPAELVQSPSRMVIGLGLEDYIS